MSEILSVRGGRLFSVGIWTLVAGIVFLWSGLIDFDFSPSGYNIKRVVQTSWFLLIFLFLMRENVRKEINGVIVSLPAISVFLFFTAIVAGIISSLLSEYPYKGIQEVALYSLLFLSVLFIASCRVSDRQVIAIAICLGTGVFLYFYGFLFRYAVHIQYPPEAWMHTTYQFSNPRTLNHAQNWLIPLFGLLPIFSLNKSVLIKILSWLPIVVMYFFLFLTGGRGLTLALLVTFAMSFYLLRVNVAPLLRIHFYALTIGLICYFVLIQLVPALLGHGFDTPALERLSSGSSSAERLELWGKALKSFSDSPWFGDGPQHYILQTVQGPGSPHNLILQWLSEWGVIATICFLGAIIVLFREKNYMHNIWQWSYKLNDSGIFITICLLMGASSAFLHSFVSGVFITPMSQLLMVMVLGISLGRYKEKQKKEYFPNKWLTNTFYGGTFFLGVSYFAVFYWEFLAEQYPVALFMESAAPRFWQNGAFPLYL